MGCITKRHSGRMGRFISEEDMKIYIQLDNDKITAVGTSETLDGLGGWKGIDVTDNPFSKIILTASGVPRYHLKSGTIQERTTEEIQADIDAIPPPPPSMDEKVDAAELKLTAMKPLINELLIDKPAAVVLPLISMMDDWKEGKWAAGKSLTHSGYPYKVVQTHDSTGNPTWTPDVKPALFAPWHGVSMETALPWKAPTGAQDMYKVDEYMVWTDSKIYQCKSDTAYSPIEYAQAWQLIS